MDTEHLRWILHLDMDAFFASVEQLDRPELRGKPIIIGGEADRGVVSTASYEARAFGIRSAMPIFQARKLCPKGYFIPGRMSRYKEKSREVMALLSRFSPLVEQASIDEAYLDLSGLERVAGSVEEIARSLQQAVFEEAQLTCSVGLAPVKFLAKIASDMKKPAGLTILTHAQMPLFLQSLPVGKIPGVGKQMLRNLEPLSIRTAGDVQRYPCEFWEKRFGKAGLMLSDRARGIDPSEVVTENIPKSESAENTFEKNTLDRATLTTWLLRQSERVGTGLRKRGFKGRTITLKVKYGDFSQHTRSVTLPQATNTTKMIYETAVKLLDELKPDRPLRLIGVGVSQFGDVPRQLSLFTAQQEVEDTREASLDATLDALRGKFGNKAIIRGKLFTEDADD